MKWERTKREKKNDKTRSAYCWKKSDGAFHSIQRSRSICHFHSMLFFIIRCCLSSITKTSRQPSVSTRESKSKSEIQTAETEKEKLNREGTKNLYTKKQKHKNLWKTWTTKKHHAQIQQQQQYHGCFFKMIFFMYNYMKEHLQANRKHTHSTQAIVNVLLCERFFFFEKNFN